MAASPYLSGNFAAVADEVTAKDHWFTGNGMVHGLRMRDGRAEWYRNRFVRDDDVATVKGLPPTPGRRHGMGSGVASTNVISHAGRTFAIVEAGGLPVELTDEVETIAYLEPVIVPRTPESDEDEDWLLTYVYDAATNGGEVQILHAQDFTGSPVATIHLPQRVPFGFHGNWVPDAK